jgi:hypothetical protein
MKKHSTPSTLTQFANTAPVFGLLKTTTYCCNTTLLLHLLFQWFHLPVVLSQQEVLMRFHLRTLGDYIAPAPGEEEEEDLRTLFDPLDIHSVRPLPSSIAYA